MATAKEIEEILGISSRTVESWSSTRDDKYLLAKLLKSYSKLDLKTRIQTIIEEERIKILDKNVFINDIHDNFQLIFPDVPVSKISYSHIGVDSRTGASDLVIKTNDTLYFIDETSQLPSKEIIVKRCKRQIDDVQKTDNQFYDGIKKINCIYLTAKKSAGEGESIDLDKILDKMKESKKLHDIDVNNIRANCNVTVINIDTVAKKLYDQERIILK